MRILPLTQKQEFARISRHGLKAVSKSCVLLSLDVIQPSNLDSIISIGYIVSKKVGNAVCRNRIKRRLKAAVNSIFNEYPLVYKNYVFIGRREALIRDYASLVQDIKYCLTKISRSNQN